MSLPELQFGGILYGSITLHWYQDQSFQSTDIYVRFRSGWVNMVVIREVKNKKLLFAEMNDHV